MGDINKSILKYYLVQVGELYYAGGIYRNLSENEVAKSFEFTTSEDVAFILLAEDTANKVAKVVGGIVVPKENTVEEVGKLQTIHDKYIASGNDIEKEVFDSINEVYKNCREDILKESYMQNSIKDTKTCMDCDFHRTYLLDDDGNDEWCECSNEEDKEYHSDNCMEFVVSNNYKGCPYFKEKEDIN